MTAQQKPQTPLVVLLRHGRSIANHAGILAGRLPGQPLDEHGREQAAEIPDRLSGLTVSRIIASPLERCQQTVAPLAQALAVTVETDEAIAEVDYGDWSGRPLKELADEPLWATIQRTPSAAVFPAGEALRDAAHRAATAARRYGSTPVAGDAVVLCAHGDIIKAIVEDALGIHLDLFQRIALHPAALSVISYGPPHPVVHALNIRGRLPTLVSAAKVTTVGGSGEASLPPDSSK